MKRIEHTIGICIIGFSIAAFSAGCGDSGSTPSLGSSTTGTTVGAVTTGTSTGNSTTSGPTTGGATTTGPLNTGGSTNASTSPPGTTSSSATNSSTSGTPTTGGSTGPLTYVAAAPSPTGKYSAGQASLQFTLTPTKTVYARGEPVSFTFTVTNIGQQTVISQIGISYDYQVLQGSSVIYWLTRDPNLVFAAGVGLEPTLAPGQSVRYPVDMWNQTDLQGNQVAPGQYTLDVWWTPATINGSTSYYGDQTRTNPGKIAPLLGAKPVTFTVQ